MQNAHISEELNRLHTAVLDIVAAINGPQRDDVLLRAAGVRLDRALFPLLVGIDRFGPIGVVDLAHRAGRDHTTVSRQVAKLEGLGLIQRHPGPTDRRQHRATVTPAGRAMAAQIDTARDHLLRRMLADWSPEDVATLVHLVRRFADAFGQRPALDECHRTDAETLPGR